MGESRILNADPEAESGKNCSAEGREKILENLQTLKKALKKNDNKCMKLLATMLLEDDEGNMKSLDSVPDHETCVKRFKKELISIQDSAKEKGGEILKDEWWWEQFGVTPQWVDPV